MLSIIWCIEDLRAAALAADPGKKKGHDVCCAPSYGFLVSDLSLSCIQTRLHLPRRNTKTKQDTTVHCSRPRELQLSRQHQHFSRIDSAMILLIDGTFWSMVLFFKSKIVFYDISQLLLPLRPEMSTTDVCVENSFAWKMDVCGRRGLQAAFHIRVRHVEQASKAPKHLDESRVNTNNPMAAYVP